MTLWLPDSLPALKQSFGAVAEARAKGAVIKFASRSQSCDYELYLCHPNSFKILSKIARQFL